LPDGLGVVGRHAQPVPLEGLAQRRPGGAQLGGGGVHRAESLGEQEGALGLGAVGEEAAGLPASGWRSCPVRLLSYERVLSEADVEQYAATARWGAACNLSPEGAAQRGSA
jgi:hypothetical protein